MEGQLCISICFCNYGDTNCFLFVCGWSWLGLSIQTTILAKFFWRTAIEFYDAHSSFSVQVYGHVVMGYDLQVSLKYTYLCPSSSYIGETHRIPLFVRIIMLIGLWLLWWIYWYRLQMLKLSKSYHSYAKLLTVNFCLLIPWRHEIPILQCPTLFRTVLFVFCFIYLKNLYDWAYLLKKPFMVRSCSHAWLMFISFVQHLFSFPQL